METIARERKSAPILARDYTNLARLLYLDARPEEALAAWAWWRAQRERVRSAIGANGTGVCVHGDRVAYTATLCQGCCCVQR
jgi:hypothetical protein